MIVSMPPRHGKSETVSRWGPVYALHHRPEARVLLASYAQTLPIRWARQVRDALLEPGHGAVLRRDARRVDDWSTTAGGGLLARGVGGGITGRGADLAIIDDPHRDRLDADSATMRDRVWDWYTSTLRTRLEPGGSVVLVMTRWHHDDLAGRLLEQDRQGVGEGWVVLRLPALAEEGDPLGRQPGEALWPDRYPVEELHAIRRTIGDRDWAALYQQSPTQGGATYWPPLGEWPQYRDRRTAASFTGGVYLSIDAALKQGPGTDYLACSVWGWDGVRLWLLDEVHTRAGYEGSVDQIRALCARMGRVPDMALVEDAALGPALMEMLRREQLALQVRGIKARASKEARATAAGVYVRQGMVLIPDPVVAPWVVDWAREHEQFPRGAHDDRVDATSQMVLAAFVEQSLASGIYLQEPDLASESRYR